MAGDHFVPAALLGRFSVDEGKRYRSRRLNVLRKGASRAYLAKAETVGYENNLYDVDFDASMSEHGAGFVDALWKEYEPRLPTALDLLSEGRCDLDHWINVLVPFVASLLIRDRWYGERLANAHQWKDHEEGWLKDAVFSESNLNLNRIVQRNGIMGRLLVSRWSMLEVEDDLCTSDLGYAFELDQVERDGRVEDRVFLVVPLSRRAVLFVAPEPVVQVLEWREGRWGREILSLAHNQVNAADVNDTIARCAQDFVAGSQAAVDSVDPGSIGKISPAELQAIQEYWPYRARTNELAGVWGALRLAANGVPPADLGRTLLEPHIGLTDRFDRAVTTVNVGPARQARVLQDVIDCGPTGFRFTW
ncbi:DUF4238 domain-containing protein [Agromyces sp. Root81]|uniref:DUF4238 domain-containing protein n=1 Tax=Agromyces sp. Root81 TaxID=1736601 RepID=UPI0009E7A7FA|nr:DUF4238 domain-containing protein [Agromyces sp. Root81]